jgi:acetoin utilization protein AcuB
VGLRRQSMLFHPFPDVETRAGLCDDGPMLPIPRIALRELMTRQIVTVSMDDSLRRVRELFESHHFHHVLVVEGYKLVGIISDRDLLRNISPFVGRDLAERAQDLATLNRRVHQVMSRNLITAGPDTLLDDAIQVVLEHDISCLPVVDEQQHPLGIITWRDILRLLVVPKA